MRYYRIARYRALLQRWEKIRVNDCSAKPYKLYLRLFAIAFYRRAAAPSYSPDRQFWDIECTRLINYLPQCFTEGDMLALTMKWNSYNPQRSYR